VLFDFQEGFLLDEKGVLVMVVAMLSVSSVFVFAEFVLKQFLQELLDQSFFAVFTKSCATMS